MPITHQKSNLVSDLTGTVTVFASNGSTTTAAATDLVRPSNWNEAHAIVFPLLGNTANASSGGGTDLALSAMANLTLVGSGTRIGLSVADPITQSIQTQGSVAIQGSTGAISFGNGGGVSFGFDASTITAAHNGLTTQSGQAVSAANGSSTFQTLGLVDGGGVSWSTTAGGVRASVRTDYLTTAALSNHSHGNPTLALTNLSGTTASASDGLTLSLSAAAPGAGVALSAGTQSVGTGTVVFADSNGIAFGMSGSSRITASHNGLTTAALSNHSHGNPTLALTNLTGTTASASNGLTLSLSAASQTVQTQDRFNLTLSGNTAGVMAQVSSGTLSLAGGNNITLSQNGNAITISGANLGGAQTGISGLANSETTYTSGTVSLSALGAITIRSTTGQQFQLSVNAQSTQPVAVQGSNGSFVFSTLSLSNANGMSFGTSAGSAVTASYTVPTVTNSSWSISDAATSGTVGRLAFTNLNGVTLSLSTGANGSHTIVGSHNGLTTAAASNHSHGNPTLALTNLTGTTASASNGFTLSLSAAAPVAQTAQTLGLYGSSQTYGQSSSSTVDARSLSIVGSGGISVGLSAGSLLISGQTTVAQSVQPGIQSIAFGNTTFTTGAVSFSNANGFSLGSSGGQVTASYTVPNVPAQTAQSIGLYASSQTYGQSSSSTVDARSLSIVGSGGVSVGMSAGSLLISGQTTAAQTAFVLSNSNNVSFGTNGSTVTATASFAQSVQAAAIYASSQTYGQSSSSAVDIRSLTIVGQGGISAGLSAGSLVLSGQTTAAQTAFVLSNSNNVSFGTNGSTVTATATFAQTAQTLGLYASSQTYGQSSSSTVDARSLSVVGSGGISVGLSAGTLLISGQTTAAQTNQALGLYALSQTTQSSSGTADARSLSFAGAGGVSVGVTGGTVVISGGAGGGGITGIVVSAGGAQTSLSSLVFSNSNNVSFGLNGSTITATATFAQSVQGQSGYALGNTTAQSSSSGLDVRSLSVSALGGMSAGLSAGALVVSAPGTSSLSGTGQVSISVNGSTISIGVPNAATDSGFSPYADRLLVAQQMGQGSLYLDPLDVGNAQFDRAIFMVSITGSSNSTMSATLNFALGLFTRNGSTLSLLGSASRSIGIVLSGTVGDYSLLSGMRQVSIPWTRTLTDGQYWIGAVSSTSSAGANFSSLSQMVVSNVAGNFLGQLGVAQNTTMQVTLGQGVYTAATSQMPSSIAFSQIRGSDSLALRPLAVSFASSTV